MGDPYVIKKYRNRKYYDSHQHKYVSIGCVFELFEALRVTESPLKVVDSKNNDITTITIIEGIKNHMVQHPEIIPGVVDHVLTQSTEPLKKVSK